MEGEKLRIERPIPDEFTDLEDTPASYTGEAGNYIKVNAGETALEFGTPAGAGDMTKAVYDPNDEGEIRLTPKATSSGAEGTIFYDSDDDHVWVATE